MARKDFKDYSLLKWYAKKAGAQKGEITKNSIISTIDYGESFITFEAIFEAKRCTGVEYDLEDVWKVYAKDRFETYDDFLKGYSSEWAVNVETIGNNKYVCVPVTDTRLEHSASQAFSSISLIFASLNKFLGKNIDSFGEGDIRDFHRTYLATRKKWNFIFMILSFVGAIADGVGVIVLSDPYTEFHSTFVLALMFFLCPALILAGVFFLFNFLFFKQQLGRSLKAGKR